MPILQVSAEDLPAAAVLAAAVAGLPAAAPVVILLHGYRFSPASPQHDPHRHILADSPDPDCWKAISWPRHLGLSGGQGLAIGFGWEARGTIWAAHAQAKGSAVALARLIRRLRQIDPHRPVHIFAHSLGARVAFCALTLLPPGAVQRLILLAAALFRPEARAALATPAGQTAQVFNVLGRENLMFDLLLRAALPHLGASLGRGNITLPHWLDLPLDDPASLLRLADIGYPIPMPAVRICHWSGYLRPGVWRLYRDILLHPAQTPLAYLQDQLAAGRQLPVAVKFTLPFRRHRAS